MMIEFKGYHPTVNFVYFFAVIGFSMTIMHPVCLVLSLVCAVSYSILLRGRDGARFQLIYILPLFIAWAVMNPAFNHEGVTILAYLPDGNPLTLESVVYGLVSACVMSAVIAWFSCFNSVMTSDKLMYIFGTIIPSLSLIFSMVLRFVPMFSQQLKSVARAQRCVGADGTKGGITARFKNGIKILSIMVTWCLESAVERADSMKSRGYGLPNRTAYSNYRFSRADGGMLAIILVLSGYVIISALAGQMKFEYFPSIRGAEITVKNIGVFVAYFFLCVIPLISEAWEVYKWKVLKSKI